MYILPTAIGMVLGLFACSGLRFFRNRKKPFFEIQDDILLYKTYWGGSIQEYPLQIFDKKIETFKVLFEEHLKAPGMSNQTESIYIGMLNKNEKRMFLEYLIEKVNSLKNG